MEVVGQPAFLHPRELAVDVHRRPSSAVPDARAGIVEAVEPARVGASWDDAPGVGVCGPRQLAQGAVVSGKQLVEPVVLDAEHPEAGIFEFEHGAGELGVRE